jgi:hypothetical protein
VWLTEHAFTGYNAFSDPLILGSHLAALAPRLHLGLSIAVGALHHPIRFATQTALLDNLTGGRFICGVGSGIGPDEFAGYGLSPQHRHELLDAWTRVVIEAWTTHRAEDPPFVYDTPWWHGTIDGRIIPAPLQQPHPPLARATLTPEFVRAQGRQGLPLLLSLSVGTGEFVWNTYLEGLDEGHLSEAQRARALKWTGFSQQVYISDSADPIAEVWPYALTYLSKGVRANPASTASLKLIGKGARPAIGVA